MNLKAPLIFALILFFSCNTNKELSPKKVNAFNTRNLVGFYEDGCTEYTDETGEKGVDCPFLDLGNPENNPKYEIQLIDKTSGYYILHHGKNYDRPAKRDTSQLTIIKKGKETIMQIVSKRDTVLEVIESMTTDTLITRNALHDIRYFYPRMEGK